MSVREPLLSIVLHDRLELPEGRASIDHVAPLLKDLQLCVRRLGQELVAKADRPVDISASQAWRSCTLDIVAFDTGSFCVHLDISQHEQVFWEGQRTQLGLIAVDVLLDLISNFENDAPAPKEIPIGLMPPLTRIFRLFDRGISEIKFSRLGLPHGPRNVLLRENARYLFFNHPEDRGVQVVDSSETKEPLPEPPRVLPHRATARDLFLALRENGLIGKWKDRTDIGETEEFARYLREQASKRRNE
jgi:hypothetical protein